MPKSAVKKTPSSRVKKVPTVVAKKGSYVETVGRRKTAIARIRLSASSKSEFVVNQKPLEDIEPDQWQDFVNELIPPGLSKLFFFDGFT
ncbi:hypothetical protein IIC44_03130 [Patescibacteria group bacterium]|nr:hypothetical protein [Patescibacteria group bacterium]